MTTAALTTLLVAVLIVGLILGLVIWAIQSAPFIPAKFKEFGIFIAILIAVVYLLQYLPHI